MLLGVTYKKVKVTQRMRIQDSVQKVAECIMPY